MFRKLGHSTVALLILSCASGSQTRWVRLETPIGYYAVDTVNTRLLSGQILETRERIVNRGAYDPSGAWDAQKSSTWERVIELDCGALLWRESRRTADQPPLHNTWTLQDLDRRSLMAEWTLPRAENWVPLAEQVQLESKKYDRAGFLCTHACLRLGLAQPDDCTEPDSTSVRQ